MPDTPPNGFMKSLGHAWDGLMHCVVHQRNMRMHIISSILVALVGSGIKLGLAEKVTLIFCVLLIIFAEMLNSALEQLVDLATDKIDERAKLTKDIAAGGVLVLAAGTVVIFAAVLVHNFETVAASLDAVKTQVFLGVPLTFTCGALMHETQRNRFVQVVLLVVSLGLWIATLFASESQVFSSMLLVLIVVCFAAGMRRIQRPL
jgi:diacylglycerol kinase (ATP)